MTQTTITETTTLKRKIRQLNSGILIIIIGGCVVLLALCFVSNQQAKRYKILLQEQQALKESQIAIQNLQQFTAGKIDQLAVVSKIFPDDSSIISIMEELETLVHRFDPQGTVRFTPQGPVKVNNQLSASLVFHFTATPSETIALLRQLERLPHVIQVKNMEVKTPQGASNPAEVTLTVILYVQDPFSESN
jgi:hypothetical protein